MVSEIVEFMKHKLDWKKIKPHQCRVVVTQELMNYKKKISTYGTIFINSDFKDE